MTPDLMRRIGSALWWGLMCSELATHRRTGEVAVLIPLPALGADLLYRPGGV